ncbi:NAD(P)/FAD-dependent oxidoreductase [Amycolatopsis sp. H20-H5]|uniref:NAD(P)/FAD-dependent oxidoreductase n=1 Tax=Amycolatopsis sp. H20-H5 TaxID=3046309 RepID=UPI002DB9517E|nr:FAD-binding protein [Amycolatopsis sp. H20-H5]MEC3974978.1 FAD-binding protein [Amycolatopsis sp. H20-H5]
MARIVIVGAGVAGLAAALATAREGHDVLVLEGSAPPPEGPVEEVASRWHRLAVPQARHTHSLTSLGVQALRARAPDVLDALLEVGAPLLDLTRSAPHDQQPDDPDLVALGCRRTVLELVLHRAVRDTAGVVFRYNDPVRGVSIGADRRVTAVLLDGVTVAADLVVDATGRRGRARDWLIAAGQSVPPDRVVPTKQLILGRFYRRPGPLRALNRGNAAGVVSDHYIGVLHPGDCEHFSVAIGLPLRDKAFSAVREPAVFDAVAAATPWVGDWFADGRAVPVSGVGVLGSPPNRLGGLAIDPAPPVAGVVQVGDAACVTDPTFGRGMSLALVHGLGLADLVAETSGDDLMARAARFAADLYEPWFEHAAAESTDRLRRLRQAALGDAGSGGAPTGLRAVGLAATRDPVVWHGLTRVLMGLDRPDLFDKPAFAARVSTALAEYRGVVPRGAPTRAELVDVIARTSRVVSH